MKDYPIEIVEYNPDWPGLFVLERDHILAACGGSIQQIEHIGSTAVPGLPAKPIIDILAGVDSLSTADRLVPMIKSIGYEYVSIFETDLPERRYFVKEGEQADLVHIHMVVVGTDFWRRHILFRDYLRSHADIRDEYGRLKRSLAERYRDNRSDYTDAKTDFIIKVQDLAGFTPTLVPSQS